MSWKGKRVKIILVGDAKEEYFRLNEIVGEEISNAKDSATILGRIMRNLCVSTTFGDM